MQMNKFIWYTSSILLVVRRTDAHKGRPYYTWAWQSRAFRRRIVGTPLVGVRASVFSYYFVNLHYRVLLAA